MRMTIDRAGVLEAIFRAIDEVNDLFPKKLGLAKSPDTVLFGNSSDLDSMGLVSLIVATEQQLRDRHGLDVTLADERAVSRNSSPFRTVASLADYILELSGETGA